MQIAVSIYRSKPFGKVSLEKETVLCCLVGLSPAVITETIWALIEENPSNAPDRVYALTTRAGMERIQESLFTNNHWNQFIEKLERRFSKQFADKMRFGPTSNAIKVFSSNDFRTELQDIRNLNDSEAIADQLLDFIRPFSENPDCRLIASISGGRKTMSALFHSVMTLLGRSDDRVVHVLVKAPWDQIPQFLYPECNGDFKHPKTGKKLDSNQAVIELAEVPFVPLRYAFPDQTFAGSYLQTMNRYRKRVLEGENGLKLQLNIAKGTCQINETTLRLTPREFIFLALFAWRCSRGQLPYSLFDEITGCEIQKCLTHFNLSDTSRHWSQQIQPEKWEPKEDPRKLASSIRSKIKRTGFDTLAVSMLIPQRGRVSMQLPRHCIEIHNEQ